MILIKIDLNVYQHDTVSCILNLGIRSKVKVTRSNLIDSNSAESLSEEGIFVSREMALVIFASLGHKCAYVWKVKSKTTKIGTPQNW